MLLIKQQRTLPSMAVTVKNMSAFYKKDLQGIFHGKDIVSPILNKIMNKSKIVLGAVRLKESTAGLHTRVICCIGKWRLGSFNGRDERLISSF